jgi:hypothetical protein
MDYLSTFTSNADGLSQSQHQLHYLVESKSTEMFDLFHMNVYGPCPNELFDSSKYPLTIIDDCSHLSYLFFLLRKSDISITLRAFIYDVKRPCDKNIKRICNDNGTKYILGTNKYFFLICRLIYEGIPAYSPELHCIT